ncbi:MAG: DUF3500 domain-containing protein [Saprospiraceae bacterium]|nr:DUF3500 domain-containing protein [Saprospiraceae bacterium]
MQKPILLILTSVLFNHLIAQQTVQSSGHKVTFKLQLSEIKNPDTLSIMWFVLPYVAEKTVDHISLVSTTKGVDGLYEHAITFPDSIMNETIAYAYIVNNKQYDIWRTLVLDKHQNQDRVESWGYVDGLKNQVKVTQMLFNIPDSPEEIADLSKPYVGITTNGQPIKRLFPIKKTGFSTETIKKAVSSFLATLSEEQKTKSVFPIQSKEWRRWHNIEQWPRAGICLEEMNTTQKELAFAFLKESLSVKGYKKAKDIMTMEAYLATLVPESTFLGGEKYWITFFGMPSDEEPWGWQIEGHHLVINYFILGDQIVMTPTFMGSEPTLITTGENQGFRTFVQEEMKGLNFYKSLDSLQKKTALLWNEKDFDFNRGEAFRDNEIIATTGIAAKYLSKKQQAALLELIGEYINNIRDEHAKVKMEEVKKHLNETHFTWVQGKNIEGPFYYRIHSPVILIEFDHQNPVFLHDDTNPNFGPVKTHIHTVVRTPNGNDYGNDLLRAHLEQHKH